MSEETIYSNKELLEAINRVDRNVHAVDLRLTQVETLIVQQSDVRKDHEERIRALELWLYRVLPLVVGVLEVIRRVVG